MSGGRGPKKILKPVFNQSVAAQQPQTATQSAPQQTVSPAATTAAPIASDAPSAYGSPAKAASTASTPPPTPAHEEKTVKVASRSSIGLSIKAAAQRKENSEKSHTATAAVNMQPQDDLMFNENDLNYYWQSYAAQLPKIG